jgi:hypothetical protein
LQKLIPNNIRLLRALEQMFIDVNKTLPEAIQQVGDNSQAITEDVSMGVFGATDRKSARLAADLADALGQHDNSELRKVAARLSDLEKIVFDQRDPVKPRVEAFIAPTLLNAWVNFGAPRNPAGYFKDLSGVVHLRGVVKNGTIGLAIFTLPAGYRPANKELIVTVSNGGHAVIEIDSSGNVIPSVGVTADFSMDNITFRPA